MKLHVWAIGNFWTTEIKLTEIFIFMKEKSNEFSLEIGDCVSERHSLSIPLCGAFTFSIEFHRLWVAHTI